MICNQCLFTRWTTATGWQCEPGIDMCGHFLVREVARLGLQCKFGSQAVRFASSFQACLVLAHPGNGDGVGCEPQWSAQSGSHQESPATAYWRTMSDQLGPDISSILRHQRLTPSILLAGRALNSRAETCVQESCPRARGAATRGLPVPARATCRTEL